MWSELRNNWKSGVTVALVSLPLSVSLALAAGATPVMGVITAIWAGLVSALLGGCVYNIVGPTGALSGILATYAFAYGVGALPVLAVASGAITLAFWAFRFGKYIVLIPASVIHGFTLGVAFIIGLNQLNFAAGLTGLETHESLALNLLESVRHLGEADGWTAALFAVSLAFLLLMARRFPRIPGAIVLAGIGIGIGFASESGYLPVVFQTLNTRFRDLTPRLFEKPELTAALLDVRLLSPAISVALIGMIETLISAKIADGMTHTRTDTNRELLGLGTANIVSGLFGGIPATAALARTSLNIKSGAKSRASAVISALVVVLISFAFLTTFRFLPLAVVAAVLVNVAVRMVEAEHFRALLRVSKRSFFLSMNVAAITIIEDPIVGIAVGAAVALLIYVNRLSKGQSEVTIARNRQPVAVVYGADLSAVPQATGDTLVYRFAGALTYINAQSHVEILTKVGLEVRTVVLNFHDVFYVDIDGLEAIEHIVNALKGRGVKVLVSDVNRFAEPLLLRAKWYQAKQQRAVIFPTTEAALRAAEVDEPRMSPVFGG